MLPPLVTGLGIEIFSDLAANRTYRGLARHMALNHRPTRSALESASTSRPGLHKSTSGTYVCNQCAQTYDCESQLVAHQVCLHQGFEGEQYPCPYCLKIFAKQHYLALHLRRHLDEKPHKCTFCPRSFSHFSSLKVSEFRSWPSTLVFILFPDSFFG